MKLRNGNGYGSNKLSQTLDTALYYDSRQKKQEQKLTKSVSSSFTTVKESDLYSDVCSNAVDVIPTTFKRKDSISTDQKKPLLGDNVFKNTKYLFTSTPFKSKRHVNFVDSLSDEYCYGKSHSHVFTNSFSSPYSQHFTGNNTLETSIFEDKTFNIVQVNTLYLDESPVLPTTDGELNVKHSYTMNHIQRSHFRQNRRIWYLNRRAPQTRVHFHVVYLYIHRLLVCLKYFFRWIVKTSARLFYKSYTCSFLFGIEERSVVKLASNLMYSFIYYPNHNCVHWFFKKIYLFLYPLSALLSRLKSNLLISFTSNKHPNTVDQSSKIIDEVDYQEATEQEVPLFMFPFCCIGLFGIIVGCAFLLVVAMVTSDTLQYIPEPKMLGISNADLLLINGTSNNVPVYHIYPYSSSQSHFMLIGHAPVLLHLRDTGRVDTKHRFRLYKNLVSLGYHLIVPFNVVSESEILLVWSWIQQQSQAIKIIWNDVTDGNTMLIDPKDLCAQKMPPSGVIIEVEATYHGHRSLEVWACNCTAVQKHEDGDYFRYKHVKCPLKSRDPVLLYDDIVTCMEALAKKKN